MIINASHFTKGELYVEGVVIPPNNPIQTATEDHLNSFISIYESKYLKKILGVKVYKDLKGYLNREDDSGTIDKWENLINVLVGDEESPSPIACYVFYYFVRSNQQTATVLGTVELDNDNPLVSAKYKLCMAWNLMIGLNKTIIDWIDLNRSDYPGWDFDCEILKPINEFNL